MKLSLLVTAVLTVEFAVCILADVLHIDSRFCKEETENHIVCIGIDATNFTEVVYDYHVGTSLIIKDSPYLPKIPKNIFGVKIVQDLEILGTRLEVLNSDDFIGGELLQVLKVPSNKIKNLPQDAFGRLRTLQHLDLSGNDLETLPDALFANNKDLISVNFMQNRLKVIQSELFSKTTKLKSADFTLNKIERIDPNAFSNARLQYLGLSTNNLKGGIGFLQKTNDLLTLDLSFNCIKSFAYSAFGDCRSLESLNLSYTCLSKLDYGSFPLTSLKKLDISKNSLQQVTAFIFITTPNIESLSLGSSGFVARDILTFIEILPLLKEISLESEQGSCGDYVDVILKMRKLNISLNVYLPNYNKKNINGFTCV